MRLFMATEPIAEIVLNFIKKDLVKDGGKTRLESSDNLIESGLIDSLGIQKLLGFLETSFSIEISDEELLPENFETVAAICSFVSRKTNDANA